jgi:hypothetical protein
MLIRPRPEFFDPALAPPGVEINFHPRWAERPIIDARGMLVHTNGATGIGTVISARNWTLANWGVNAMPHYQCDLDGRAMKYLPSNRKGICNAKADWFFLSVETADGGWGPGDPGTNFEFTDAQMETLAHIVAFEAIVGDYPIIYPVTWDGTGVASHTEPFGYPYWTIVEGKPCPGIAKKAQVRNVLMPYAQRIVDAWTTLIPEPIPDPSPDTDEENLMDYIILPEGDWWPADYMNGQGPAWFIRFKSGILIRATGPDFAKALVTPGIGTYYCKGVDHYNELLEQSGTTLCPKI